MTIVKDSILYIGRDFAYQSEVSKLITNRYQYQSVRSTKVALELVKKFKFSIVIFDENVLYTENQENNSSASVKEIYKELIKTNHKCIFVFLYIRMTSFVKSFEKLNKSTLLFKRDDLNASRLIYVLTLLRRPQYRSVISREIEVGQSYPVPIYFLSSDIKNKKVFIEANTKIEEKLVNLLKSKKMNHLYIKRADFLTYLNYTETHCSKQYLFSSELNRIRDNTKGLLAQLCDDSLVIDIKSGKEIFEKAKIICKGLEKLVNSFPDLTSALEELPFPRWGTLNHCLNSAIYTIIFSKICCYDEGADLAVAALVQDIGKSKQDFRQITSKHEVMNFSISKKVSTEEYVFSTIELLKKKKFLTSKVVHDAILYQNECHDGSGSPFGKTGKNLKEWQQLLPLVNMIEKARSIDPGEEEQSFRDIFELIKNEEGSSDRFGRLGQSINPEIISKIAKFLN